MTRLERLIAAHVTHATETAVAQTVELTAEQLAREILSDPAFRAKMRALIERAFGETMTQLTTTKRKKTRR